MDLKSVAYKSLVRPQLGYVLTVWSPCTSTDIHKVEAVQRRAARWVTREGNYTFSVTAILKDLNWRPIEQRRIESLLVMLYSRTRIPHPQHQTIKTHSRTGLQTESHSKRLLRVHSFQDCYPL